MKAWKREYNTKLLSNKMFSSNTGGSIVTTNINHDFIYD